MNMERRLSRNGARPQTTTNFNLLPANSVGAMVGRNGIGGLSISLCTIVIGGLIIYLLVRK